MSKEFRSVTFAFTVHSPDNLPAMPNGEQMYADDVVDEIYEALDQALKGWYAERGHELLASEPV